MADKGGGTSPVAILMGSIGDWETLKGAKAALDELGLGVEVRVLSAHRTPDETSDFARQAQTRGVRVIIAAAGGAAHLAGVIAAHTTLPVIAVPIAATPLGGLDALLAMVQMPAGIPVATVAIGGAQNAALLAASILALSDASLAKRLSDRRAELRKKVLASDAELTAKLRA